MIKILDIKDENILGYSFDGKIAAEDVELVWKHMEEKITAGGKIRLYAEAREWNVSDITVAAVVKDLRLWLRHPGVITRIEKAAFVTDSGWLKGVFDVECSLIPTLEGAAFSFEDKAWALDWLRSGRAEVDEVNIKWAELVEIGILRSAAGIGFGLLAADLFGGRKRRAVGWTLLLGSLAAGIPLGLKFIKKNKEMICD